MKVMLLWFVLLNGNAGYIEPIDVMMSSCSAPSPTPGTLTIDRDVNPRTARWSNCLVDITSKVSSLNEGLYELATTELGVSGYLSPDPHTSREFVVSRSFEPPADQGTVTSTAKFSWTQEDPLATAQAYRYELELDGKPAAAPLAHTCIVSPTNPNFSLCTAPAPAMTAGTHNARVRTVDASIGADPATWLSSDYTSIVTFAMRLTPKPPTNLTIIAVPGK